MSEICTKASAAILEPNCRESELKLPFFAKATKRPKATARS